MSTLRAIRARLLEVGGVAFDTDIAREVGISHNRIGELRRELHIPAAPGKVSRFNWAAVDFTRPPAEIAAELGCSAVTVCKHRRRVAARGEGR
jgi:hypothetical protein